MTVYIDWSHFKLGSVPVFCKHQVYSWSC